MRSTTCRFSGIMRGAALETSRLGHCHISMSNQLYSSPFTNRYRVTNAVPAVLFAVHVYVPLLLLSTGLMVRTDPFTPSVTRIWSTSVDLAVAVEGENCGGSTEQMGLGSLTLTLHITQQTWGLSQTPFVQRGSSMLDQDQHLTGST